MNDKNKVPDFYKEESINQDGEYVDFIRKMDWKNQKKIWKSSIPRWR